MRLLPCSEGILQTSWYHGGHAIPLVLCSLLTLLVSGWTLSCLIWILTSWKPAHGCKWIYCGVCLTLREPGRKCCDFCHKLIIWTFLLNKLPIKQAVSWIWLTALFRMSLEIVMWYFCTIKEILNIPVKKTKDFLYLVFKKLLCPEKNSRIKKKNSAF